MRRDSPSLSSAFSQGTARAQGRTSPPEVFAIGDNAPS